MIKSRIKKLIENSGYKRSFIADKLGVSVKQLGNYISGHSFIPMDKAYELSDLLKCSVDDLYERVHTEPLPQFFMHDPIEILQLSKRSYNALKRSGINTVQELLEKEDVIQLRGVGAVSTQEISEKINEVRKELKQ